MATDLWRHAFFSQREEWWRFKRCSTTAFNNGTDLNHSAVELLIQIVQMVIIFLCKSHVYIKVPMKSKL